ncbi:hypothetical protein FQN54_009239 [Arachnomyces sp. PD_36]|nr:hypothetical protein FQN54_009239 [Arachnomyces sp. PD_36]
MVFSFSLPTTSHLSFQSFLSSSTHPSLPQSASIARHSLRIALKKHRHLPSQQQSSNLPSILNALNEYIPYLFTLSDGLRGKTGGEEVDIILRSEIEVEWRTTLTTTSSSFLRTSRRLKGRRQRHRVRGRGLDFEIAFTLATLGYVLSGIARDGVTRTLYASSTRTVEQRTAAIQAATKNLLMASAVHAFVASPALDITASIVTVKSKSRTTDTVTDTGVEGGGWDATVSVPDLDSATQSSLSALALSEATLLAVLKDDAYVAATIQARNPNDREWMIKAPEIPKVRALVFARLCVRGAEYAEQAASGAEGVGARGDSSQEGKEGKVDDELVDYMRAVAGVAKARACRFFGIDAEMGGKTGEGIAWLRAGRGILKFKKGSLEGDEEDSGAGGRAKGKGLSRLKKGWADMREERKMEKQAGSGGGSGDGELGGGDDAGREEEGRVLDMLEAKWVKMNDTINTQLIPSPKTLLTTLPSGRDIHSPQSYTPPSLGDSQLIRMRAPPEDDDNLPGAGDDGMDSSSEDDGGDFGKPGAVPPGGFPESRASSGHGSGYF